MTSSFLTVGLLNVVIDPLNILEEGEVCYRFSQPRKDPATDMLVYALEGEILVLISLFNAIQSLLITFLFLYEDRAIPYSLAQRRPTSKDFCYDTVTVPECLLGKGCSSA